MSTTKEILRNAYVNLAADTLYAFNEWGQAEARRQRVELGEFPQLFHSKVEKLRQKGRLGPKAWAKLQDQCPTAARSYLSGFAGGFDMTTDEGFVAFLAAVKGVSRHLPDATRLSILENFATLVADAFDQDEAEGPEDEDEDAA